MAQHARYWSCSGFADWIRGTPKLQVGTSQEWMEWRKKAKTSHPFRFWLAEEGLDRVQDFVSWPARKIHGIKYYINNRWVTRTHALTAHPSDIKPGTWRDFGDRFLPCLFNQLVDFIEVELAWKNIAWSEEARRKYQAPWYSWGWFRWRTWRCPEAGLDYLRWESSLVYDEYEVEEGSDLVGKPTQQATKALEIMALYDWWKNQRPLRQDPHDESGWSALCERRREQDPDNFLWEDQGEEQQEETRRILDLCNQLESRNEEEDDAMLIRLIKLRKSLWS